MKKKKRFSVVKRKTSETNIVAELSIDGAGKAKINTGIGILDHMLELFAFWGFFDLNIAVKGDLRVDLHHTNEDTGIVLGELFKKALADKRGIRRFGFAQAPMEEIVANVVLDISGRGFFSLKADKKFISSESQTTYSLADAEHFFDAFAKHLGVNLNISVDLIKPDSDLHAVLETIFKALGLALDQSVLIDHRRKSVPSTKGVID